MTGQQPRKPDVQWAPRTGDRLTLRGPAGRPLSTWLIGSCAPVRNGDQFALVITRVDENRETT